MSQHIGPEITSTEALITRAAKFNELISFIGNIKIFQKAFYKQNALIYSITKVFSKMMYIYI